MNTLPRGISIRHGHLEYRFQYKNRDYVETLDLAPTAAHIREAVRQREEHIVRLKYGIAEPVEIELKPGSFADIAQAYLDDADLKGSTRASYKNLINVHWMPAFAHQAIDTITPAQIKTVAREIDWTSIKTKKNAATALRQVFEWAVDEDYITDSPAARYRTKRKKDDAKPKADPYTIEERNTLLNWLKASASQSTHAYFMLAFYSGMRTVELLALQWADYDGGSFMVEKSRTRGKIVTTKTDEVRRVLIQDQVCKVLNALPTRFKKGFVFLTEYGKPYQSGHHLNEVFLKAHEATGTRRSTSPNYPWRHTYASVGLTSGLEPAFLAKQLGHSISVFESTYAKWLDREEDREKLERML